MARLSQIFGHGLTILEHIGSFSGVSLFRENVEEVQSSSFSSRDLRFSDGVSGFAFGSKMSSFFVLPHPHTPLAPNIFLKHHFLPEDMCVSVGVYNGFRCPCIYMNEDW